MFGPRMLIGAMIGGALVYFLDPHQGPERRARLRSWWEQNREPVMSQAASAAAVAQSKVSATSARVGDKVSEVQSRVKRGPSRPEVEEPSPVHP